MERRYVIRDKVTKKISYAPGWKADFRTIGTAELIYNQLDLHLQKPYLEVYDTLKDEVIKVRGSI